MRLKRSGRAGWNRFPVRGLVEVRGEWSLMAPAYNFTRVLAIPAHNAFAPTRPPCLRHDGRPNGTFRMFQVHDLFHSAFE